jgi:hypothetical protein
MGAGLVLSCGWLMTGGRLEQPLQHSQVLAEEVESAPRFQSPVRRPEVVPAPSPFHERDDGAHVDSPPRSNPLAAESGDGQPQERLDLYDCQLADLTAGQHRLAMSVERLHAQVSRLAERDCLPRLTELERAVQVLYETRPVMAVGDASELREPPPQTSHPVTAPPFDPAKVECAAVDEPLFVPLAPDPPTGPVIEIRRHETQPQLYDVRVERARLTDVWQVLGELAGLQVLASTQAQASESSASASVTAVRWQVTLA